MRYAVLGLIAAGWYALATPAHHGRAQGAQGEQGDRWSWHGRVATGKTLEIHGINGGIVAEAASGDEAEVTAVKHEGRRGSPDDVRIEKVESADGVTICAVYPGQRNPCTGGRESHRGENDTQVEFTVRVPRGVAFSGNTVNGGVEARGLAGPVQAHTVNNGIEIETSAGEAEASTVNGGITAIVSGTSSRSLRFHTVNGGITVTLPRDLSAEVEAATVNGSFSSDFPLTVEGRMNQHRVRGRIGQGGRLLDLTTVNGSIRIRSGP